MMSNKIDTQLFSAHEHALDNEICPQCQHGNLRLKNGKHGPFLGCSDYPGCGYIKPLHQNDGHVVKELGLPCPECQSELVLRQGRYGMFIGCSDYPNCHFIQSPNQLNSQKASTKNAITCPECKKGQLTERKSRFGKTFYACNQFPKCKFAVNQQPHQGPCEVCGFGVLLEKKKASGTVLECASRQCQRIQEQS